MDVNAVIVELLGRIVALEHRVDALEERIRQLQNPQNPFADRPPFPADQVSQKYRPLADYLYEKWERRTELSYEELERILGFALPQSAHTFPKSYWANTLSHSYATTWLALGYKAKVAGENDGKKVVFRR